MFSPQLWLHKMAQDCQFTFHVGNLSTILSLRPIQFNYGARYKVNVYRTWDVWLWYNTLIYSHHVFQPTCSPDCTKRPKIVKFMLEICLLPNLSLRPIQFIYGAGYKVNVYRTWDVWLWYNTLIYSHHVFQPTCMCRIVAVRLVQYCNFPASSTLSFVIRVAAENFTSVKPSANFSVLQYIKYVRNYDWYAILSHGQVATSTPCNLQSLVLPSQRN